MNVLHLFISPGHNFFGHHGRPAGTHPMLEQEQIECIAGSGIRGDRFFDYKPDYKGQITFFSYDVLSRLWEELAIPPRERDPSSTRRNVLVGEVDLNQLIGREFSIQGIRFFGTEECRPCYWMNGVIHPEAENWMRGRGGLRARILSSGFLQKSREDAPLQT